MSTNNTSKDALKWHPEPAKHVGNSGPVKDYTEVWEFPCCKKQVLSDPQPSQEREDGCKLKGE